MKRLNVSSCDWLNFINLSVSLPWQLEFLITPLYESTGIFLSCTYVHSTPFKLHAPPSPYKNWTLIIFAEKQPTLLYCINKVFKTLQVLYNLLLTQLSVRFLCILRLTWWGVPVSEHNQNFTKDCCVDLSNPSQRYPLGNIARSLTNGAETYHVNMNHTIRVQDLRGTLQNNGFIFRWPPRVSLSATTHMFRWTTTIPFAPRANGFAAIVVFLLCQVGWTVCITG